MFAGKTLIDFTSWFSPYDFEKNDTIIWNILSISESNSIEIMDKTNLTNQAKFKLNEISKI